MPTRGKGRQRVEADVKKAGKDVEVAVEKGVRDVKKAGSKLTKKL